MNTADAVMAPMLQLVRHAGLAERRLWRPVRHIRLGRKCVDIDGGLRKELSDETSEHTRPRSYLLLC